MKHVRSLSFILIACWIGMSSPARGAEKTASTAAEAAAELFAAIAAKDLDRAIALTAPAQGVAPDAVRAYYQRLAERAKPARVVAHLALDDTAVAVFREGGDGEDIIDLDPAYLVRRDGKWLVLFKLTRFDRPNFELDEKSLASFKKLAAWFEEQKPKLQALLRKEA